MNKNSIDVQIVNSTEEFVNVKLPFLDVPIQMTHGFFTERVKNGYFNVDSASNSPSGPKSLNSPHGIGHR